MEYMLHPMVGHSKSPPQVKGAFVSLLWGKPMLPKWVTSDVPAILQVDVQGL